MKNVIVRYMDIGQPVLIEVENDRIVWVTAIVVFTVCAIGLGINVALGAA